MKLSTMRQLNKKYRALEIAQQSMKNALELAYPVGQVVDVWLMHTQVAPSQAQVIDYRENGNVVVRLGSRTRAVKHVHFKKIVGYIPTGPF